MTVTVREGCACGCGGGLGCVGLRSAELDRGVLGGLVVSILLVGFVLVEWKGGALAVGWFVLVWYWVERGGGGTVEGVFWERLWAVDWEGWGEGGGRFDWGRRVEGDGVREG